MYQLGITCYFQELKNNLYVIFMQSKVIKCIQDTIYMVHKKYTKTYLCINNYVVMKQKNTKR